jgi:hypothetical protein
VHAVVLWPVYRVSVIYAMSRSTAAFFIFGATNPM